MLKKILRLCHKFLLNEDGYDIGLRDLIDLLGSEFEQYVVFFIQKNDLVSYVLKNKLVKKNGFYYSREKNVFLVPIFYKKKYNNYIRDLFLRQNIFKFKEEFEKVLVRIEPDVVHIHGTLIPQFKIAGKLAKKKNKKVVVTHHMGSINKYSNQNFFIKFRKFLLHNSFPLFCDKVLCLSNHGKKSFLFNKNIEVVYGIKSIKKFYLDKNYLKSFFEVGDSLLFIYPARFSKVKNHEILIEVFEELIKEGFNLKLILVGGVSNKSYYAKIRDKSKNLKNNIFFFKEVNHGDLIKILSLSDFMIFPSLNEGLGRSGLESLSLGVPVLASNNSGQVEYIKEGVNGFLFDPFDKNSIKEIIKKAISMKDKFIVDFDEEINKRYINKLREIYN